LRGKDAYCYPFRGRPVVPRQKTITEDLGIRRAQLGGRKIDSADRAKATEGIQLKFLKGGHV